MMTKLENETCRVTRLIPPGRVLTYKALANIVGSSPQTVGNVMNAHMNEADFPWWRVVAKDGNYGHISKNAPVKQQEHLEQEGILFQGNRIDLRHYEWTMEQVSSS